MSGARSAVLLSLAALVAASALAVLAGLALTGGEAGANWEGSERENYRSSCFSTVRECGTFCIYPNCTLCNNCQCTCCSATRTNDGCYCSAPCPCWDECTPDGMGGEICVEVCQDPTLHVFNDCGPDCVEWEYLLYQGSNQPGRSDGVVENPFFTDGLGTAVYIQGQAFEGSECVEEGVGQDESMVLVPGGPVWPTVLVSGTQLPQPLGVAERTADDELELPSGVTFVETSFAAWPDSAVLAGVSELTPGIFGLTVSGVPPGRLPLFRHWQAGYGSAPLASLVPFGLVPATVELRRGWHALQAAYADLEGNPVGWSAVAVVHSRGVWDPLDPADQGLRQPVTRPAPAVPEGIEPPPSLSLGEPVVVAGSGLITFPIGAVPYGSELQYRIWSWTGSLPDPRHVPWQLGYPSGGVLELSYSGPEGDQGGYVAMQVRVRRWAGVEHGYVYGPLSTVRHFWVEPRGAEWVPVSGQLGTYQWVDQGRSLFVEPAATPVPTSQDGLGLPRTPSITRAYRHDSAPGSVDLVVGGLQGGGVWLEYRVWQATGFPPVGQQGEWLRATLNGGVLTVHLGGPYSGGYGQWMALQLRQARALPDGTVIGGDGSEVLELRVPAVLARPLGGG